ncbi:MAG TPA: hypothetical protein VK184_14135 [Nostocaceae cyanobacterium]|nr:hypothetical protein [Nostocaceae cyanobacterium]
MGLYTTDALVAVYPFTRQSEGEEVVIGHPETNVFLVLPFDAVEILDYLAVGKTIGETKLIYQEKYGEVPDIEDLLMVLQKKGFVKPLLSSQSELSPSLIQSAFVPSSPQVTKVRYHFTNFKRSLAQKIFSRPVLLGCGVLISLALMAIAFDSTVIPSWDAYLFKEDITLTILVLTVLDSCKLFLHEMAHLIAARALGISCRLGISNRMWVLVAETDMTGVWSVPRSQRYLPFLAGVILDATSAAILILLFFTANHHWITPHPLWIKFGRALLLNYLLGILWQCYFYLRTDFYFVFANFFNCKNLMKDTEVLFCNQLARVIPWLRRIDQSHIPISERRVISCYAVLWLVGRTAAISALIFISLPLMWQYWHNLFSILSTGYQANPYKFIDALLIMFIVAIPQSLGFGLWIRSFFKNNKK